MEATFSVGASKLEEELEERLENQKKRGQAGSGKIHTLEGEKPKSVWQTYLDKRKQKRQEKKAKAKAERERRKGKGQPDADEDEHKEDDKQDSGDEAATRGDLELLGL